MQKNKLVNGFIIGTFVSLYVVVSLISTIHVIDFFKLSNPDWLAISLAIAFEIGAAASLAALIALKKVNKSLVWGLFITLTLMQMMGNTYYAYTNLENYQSWVELFGLVDAEPIFQKRVLSIVSGAILPLVALGFIKSLVDYIRPEEEAVVVEEEKPKNWNEEAKRVWDHVQKMRDAGVYPEATAEEIADEPTALANSGYRERAEIAEYEEDENYEDLESASLEDFQQFVEEELQDETPMYTEEQKKEIIQDIRKDDEENNGTHPHLLPGVNM
jgi:hypothetical protein